MTEPQPRPQPVASHGQRPQFARRALLGAAAWTVPVVTVATASPAFAASPPPVEPVLGLSLRLSPDRLALELDVVLNPTATIPVNDFFLLASLAQADTTFDAAPPPTNPAWQRMYRVDDFAVFTNMVEVPPGLQILPTLRIPLTAAPTTGSVTVSPDSWTGPENLSGSLTF